ncbi:MAG: hypothetical protein IH606_15430 [Burkholderiales bacterium]|nr:hypothetical protein [Burkholderiales bacterium]
MNSSKKTVPVVALLAFCLALSFPTPVPAKEVDSSIAACLKAWGDHPFGNAPQFKTLETSVTVFGIGGKTADTQPTSTPALVLINPSFNLMGGSTIELLNPNGWYCLRTTVTVMGRVGIRAHCKAQLASTSAGSTVLGNNAANRNIKDLTVTAMGSVSVARPCN